MTIFRKPALFKYYSKIATLRINRALLTES